MNTRTAFTEWMVQSQTLVHCKPLLHGNLCNHHAMTPAPRRRRWPYIRLAGRLTRALAVVNCE